MKRRTGEGEKREAARAWGGGFMREKQAGAERWRVGPWSCPPPRTLGPSTLGAQGAPCPESHGKGRLTHWAGQTGRTLLPSMDVKRRCLWPPPPQKTAGGAAVRSSQPHSVDSQRPNGTPASIPSALLPLQLQNQRQHPTLARSARPSRVLTSEELESGRRRKQFASSSQRGVKCKIPDPPNRVCPNGHDATTNQRSTDHMARLGHGPVHLDSVDWTGLDRTDDPRRPNFYVAALTGRLSTQAPRHDLGP